MIQDIRKRILVIAGISLGVVLALVLFILVLRERRLSPSSAPISPNAPGSVTPPSSAIGRPSAKPAQPVGDPEEIYLRQLSRIFVERFGSYSNQNDNQHIADVMAISTKKMQTYISSKDVAFNPSYRGATTVVVASHVTSHTAAKATVVVDVQRIVLTNSASKTEYQTGTLTLVKEVNVWKIDSLYWK